MQNTKIEWAHHTFNPWIGCSKVSPGCANCYAENIMSKRFNKATWGPNGSRVKTSESNWKQPLKWNVEAKKLGVRYRVFCASLADVFEDRPELVQWRADLFDLIDATPNLDWLLLTKRPENISKLFNNPSGSDKLRTWPMENVWLGTSVENQEQADRRIPELIEVPAKVRFLSCEPLLEPLDLLIGDCSDWSCPECHSRNLDPDLHDPDEGTWWKCYDCQQQEYGEPAWTPLIHWVIVGGESGPGARPMHPDWVRKIRNQCTFFNVSFFFKQWGGVDKRATGRVLEGREWNEVPEVRK